MSTLAHCEYAPCRTSSKQENFSLLSKFSPASSHPLKYLLFLATLLVLASLLAAPGTAYSKSHDESVVVTGTMEVIVADTPQGQVIMTYFLHEDNSTQIYELLFTTISPPENLTGGQQVTVTGIPEGNQLQVETIELPKPNGKLPVVGDRYAVVIMVDLQNVKASTRYTRDQIATAMYALDSNGVPAPAGTRSVRELYQQASLGQLNFTPDTDNNGKPDVFGPFTINYSYTGTCDYQNWTAAAEAAAQQAGIDLNLYQHRVFVLPRYSDIPGCGWQGLANVGCTSFCRTWIAQAETPMTYAHELGHNLEMGHAGTPAPIRRTMARLIIPTATILTP